MTDGATPISAAPQYAPVGRQYSSSAGLYFIAGGKEFYASQYGSGRAAEDAANAYLASLGKTGVPVGTSVGTPKPDMSQEYRYHDPGDIHYYMPGGEGYQAGKAPVISSTTVQAIAERPAAAITPGSEVAGIKAQVGQITAPTSHPMMPAAPSTKVILPATPQATTEGFMQSIATGQPIGSLAYTPPPTEISPISRNIAFGAERVASVIDRWASIADVGARRIEGMLPSTISPIYTGAYEVGRGLVFTGESGLVRSVGMLPGGAEVIAKKPSIVVPAAVLAGQSMIEGITQRPLQTIGEFAVTSAVFSGVSEGLTRVKTPEITPILKSQISTIKSLASSEEAVVGFGARQRAILEPPKPESVAKVQEIPEVQLIMPKPISQVLNLPEVKTETMLEKPSPSAQYVSPMMRREGIIETSEQRTARLEAIRQKYAVEEIPSIATISAEKPVSVVVPVVLPTQASKQLQQQKEVAIQKEVSVPVYVSKTKTKTVQKEMAIQIQASPQISVSPVLSKQTQSTYQQTATPTVSIPLVIPKEIAIPKEIPKEIPTPTTTPTPSQEPPPEQPKLKRPSLDYSTQFPVKKERKAKPSFSGFTETAKIAKPSEVLGFGKKTTKKSRKSPKPRVFKKLGRY